MAQDDEEMEQEERYPFLYHIFRLDVEENPMPQVSVERLLQYLKRVFGDLYPNNKDAKDFKEYHK